MPTAPAMYPKTSLPDWPQASPDANEKRSEKFSTALSALEGLGFEVLFDDQLTPLHSLLAARQQEARLRSKLGEDIRSKSVDTRLWTQVWRHPAGIVALVERYSHDAGNSWHFNGITLAAQEDLGYGLADCSGFTVSTPHGEAIKEHAFKEDFAQAWGHLQKASSAGRLLPVEQWKGVPFERALLTHQPFHYAIPKVSSAATPSDLSNIERAKFSAAAARLGKSRLSAIQSMQMSEDERAAWCDFVGASVVKIMSKDVLGLSNEESSAPRWALKLAKRELGPRPSLYRSLTVGRHRHRRDQIALKLHYLLSAAGMEQGDHLTLQERKVVAQWLDVLSDGQHPRRIEKEFDRASNAEIPRFGIKFSQLLFASACVAGVPRKAAWWQSRQDPESLRLLCSMSEQDGMTLPMRWAHAWMETPNSRIDPRRQDIRRSVARTHLEQLMAVCGDVPWPLITDRCSVWDAAMGLEINAGVDSDLVPHHQAGVASFADWASSSGLVLPTEVFVRDVSSAVSLLNHQALQDAFTSREDLSFWGEAEPRMDMLRPLIATLEQSALRSGVISVRSPSKKPRL